MTYYGIEGRFDYALPPGRPAQGSPSALPPTAYIPPAISPAEKKPGMLSPSPFTNPDLSPGYQPSAAPVAPIAPIAPASPAAAAVQLRPSTAESVVDQLLDYQNQVGQGASLPPQMKEALVSFMMGGVKGPTGPSEDGGPDLWPLLLTKSDADLIGAAAAHAEHLRNPSKDTGVITSLLNAGIGAFGGPITAGFMGAAANPDNPLKGAALGAGTSYVAGQLVPDGAGMLTKVGVGAGLGAGMAAITHGNVKAGAVGGAIGGAIPGLSAAIAPSLNEFLASIGIDASKVSPEDLKRVVADASGSVPLYSTPANTNYDAAGNPVMSTPAMTTMGGEGMLPLPVQTGSLPTSNTLHNLDQQDKEALMKQDQGLSPKDIERVAKLAQSLMKMNGGNGVPQGAPQRGKDETPEQYGQQLAQYANIDAAQMAALGLTPGSPEYMQYIMNQMDSIIAQLTDGMDMTAADLTEQLHSKTAAELEQLQRAIYVRGQMGSLVGSGQYTDPFSGKAEDVIAPDGQTFNPATGAYQRGLARSAGELAQLRGPTAENYVKGMLGRNVDLYGMQGNKDARMLEAMLNPENADKKRRGAGGLLGNSYEEMINNLTQPELAQLVQAFGGDTERAKAALSQLLGMA